MSPIATRKRLRQAKGYFVEPLAPPEEVNSDLDRVIDALAAAWTEHDCDQQGFQYFQAFSWEKPQMIRDSLYRYPERERKFLAEQLRQFANATLSAVFGMI